MGKMIRIEVMPSAGRDEITGGEPLLVKVSSPASGGAANREAIRLLSRHFGARVRIVSGGRRRKKIIQLG